MADTETDNDSLCCQFNSKCLSVSVTVKVVPNFTNFLLKQLFTGLSENSKVISSIYHFESIYKLMNSVYELSSGRMGTG